MNEPRAYYTERSKSEREKQISYTNAYNMESRKIILMNLSAYQQWRQFPNFQIGKEVCQVCILSTCLFNFYAEYIMRNTGLEETQAGIKIVGRNINNLRYADDTTLMAEIKEELKSLLVKVKEEREKLA